MESACGVKAYKMRWSPQVWRWAMALLFNSRFPLGKKKKYPTKQILINVKVYMTWMSVPERLIPLKATKRKGSIPSLENRFEPWIAGQYKEMANTGRESPCACPVFTYLPGHVEFASEIRKQNLKITELSKALSLVLRQHVSSACFSVTIVYFGFKLCFRRFQKMLMSQLNFL